jgi:hypothetical protein
MYKIIIYRVKTHYRKEGGGGGAAGLFWGNLEINIIIYNSTNVVHLILGSPLGVWTNLHSLT